MTAVTIYNYDVLLASCSKNFFLTQKVCRNVCSKNEYFMQFNLRAYIHYTEMKFIRTSQRCYNIVLF